MQLSPMTFSMGHAPTVCLLRLPHAPSVSSRPILVAIVDQGRRKVQTPNFVGTHLAPFELRLRCPVKTAIIHQSGLPLPRVDCDDYDAAIEVIDGLRNMGSLSSKFSLLFRARH